MFSSQENQGKVNYAKDMNFIYRIIRGQLRYSLLNKFLKQLPWNTFSLQIVIYFPALGSFQKIILHSYKLYKYLFTYEARLLKKRIF